MTPQTKRFQAIPGRFLLLASSLLLFGCGQAPVITPAAPTPPPSWPAPTLVQVEDHPDAHPHAGLQRADIVYEYLTEGEISRFTAIYFHPSGSFRIGPVRSARLITLRLQQAYHGVIFYSGASNYILGLIFRNHVPALAEFAGGGRFFERDPNRFAPHNLVTTENQLKDAVQRQGLRIFYKLPAPAEPTQAGNPVRKISFNQTTDHGVTYVYQPGSRTYVYRWSFGGFDNGPEIDTSNGRQPLQVTNAVLIQVPHHGAHYVEDVLGAEGQDFSLQGTGLADVYTRGMHYKATWSLTHPDQPLSLLGPDNKPMKLPAGLTWINVIDPGTPVAVS